MIVELAEGSAAAGHDVCIAYGRRPETPADLRSVVGSEVELRAMPWTRRTPGPQLRAARELRALVREWQPDVVHLHSSFSGFIGAVVLPRALPTIFSPNAFASALPEGGAARRAVYRALERIACRRVTMVGAVSHSEAELARRLGARHVVRVPNGIRELDPEQVVTRSADDEWPDPPRVVATGRTVPQRRPADTARILAAVKDVAQVEWLGGGGGGRGVEGREALVAAGIEPTGWLAREEVLARVGASTVYLHFTAWDGLPFSVLEALALDVVVVASDIPPNREILGEAGICESPEEAAALIRRVVEDPGEAAALRARQRERRLEFGAALMVERWHGVYESVLREPQPALIPR